jgi:hypothetical protein
MSLYTRFLVTIHPPLHLLNDLENPKRIRYACTQRMPNVHYLIRNANKTTGKRWQDEKRRRDQ